MVLLGKGRRPKKKKSKNLVATIHDGEDPKTNKRKGGVFFLWVFFWEGEGGRCVKR